MKRSVQCLLSLGLITLFFSAHANAASGSLVIYQVQAGGLNAASQEFVTVYNNSAQEVNVTNWCVTNKDNKAFACLTPKAANQAFYLPSHGHMTIASEAFSINNNTYQADVIYSATAGAITGSSDTLTLKDAQNSSIDTISWTSLSGGSVLQRRMASDAITMLDTDVAADFAKVTGVILPNSAVYEVVTIVDECMNLPELQNEVPAGFSKNEVGECVFDMCSNIDGLQTTIPDDYLRRGVNDCAYDYVTLKITELLPNAAGSDTGREYIEIHNPSDRDVFLVNYLLEIGGKTYGFPASLKITPGQYMAFYNNEITFTFINTSSHATLMGDDGTTISRSDSYDSPKDDMAWALIDETWQYTNQVTFAAPNIASVIMGEDEDEPAGLAPCAANQYRHAETRRCRLLVTVASAATACKDGQYRSEETNRCRTIALASGTLSPCKDNQYRSEETNRCRNFATAASTLKPCKDDQYRSEETNRCRAIIGTSVPSAAFGVEPVADTDMAFAGWWALGSVGVLALGYAGWEWRLEAMIATRKVLSFFTQR